ncbi:DNA polymerase III subunit delta [Bacteroidales bacterium OttesenSCG-928-K03]|nr:DNA polymerase III subunit delta [Odoribacter sp. OttesenSCG-928-L07]MDL2239500.1 DNA polymerase III subunit delta [Bacteroidales bacterium OttesenSCG-928-L14]MDL2240442.1 DNA polymerase III subunit delta [Bacteroidales bacterium OttesenSCG-928-K22]MDL2242912.1 DNA polymerase III subunit delta [Bacteroidales bacterium OttesenSCG-928-K03]
MKYEELVSNLKNKIYNPIYFLTGEQTYYIDSLASIFENDVLSEDEKDFNLSILYGKDVSTKDVIAQAKQYPMMATYQVLIVKEAQDLSKIEELESYIENPLSSTILVLCYKYKKLDGRTSFYKKLKSKAVIFESAKLYDNEIPNWIENQVAKMGYKITPKATVMLSQHLGTDLQKIVNELEKLTIVVPKSTAINEEHIEKHVGVSKEYNIFELLNAIGTRNVNKAYQIVFYFSENEKAMSLPGAIVNLYQYFVKIMKVHFINDKSKGNLASALGVNPYFVKDYTTAAANFPPKKISSIFLILQEYDMKSKGVSNVNSSQGELMKEMIYKILH